MTACTSEVSRSRAAVRAVGVLALCGTVACGGHPPPPGRLPDPDDERAGATRLVVAQEGDKVEAAGTLDPAAGDSVDWYAIAQGDEAPVMFEVRLVVASSRLPTSMTVHARDGSVLGTLHADPLDFLSTAYGEFASPDGELFLCIANGAALDYHLEVTHLGLPPPPRCDLDHFDADNPNCSHGCDFARPDVGSRECCTLASPCAHDDRFGWGICGADVLRFDKGEIVVARGTDDMVGIRYLEAWLTTDPHEPLPDGPLRHHYSEKRRGNLDDQPRLWFVSATETESRWRLHYPKDHDIYWLEDHAINVWIFAPPQCYWGRRYGRTW